MRGAPPGTAVLTVGRAATGQQHPKLREIVHADHTEYAAILTTREIHAPTAV